VLSLSGRSRSRRRVKGLIHSAHSDATAAFLDGVGSHHRACPQVMPPPRQITDRAVTRTFQGSGMLMLGGTGDSVAELNRHPPEHADQPSSASGSGRQAPSSIAAPRGPPRRRILAVEHAESLIGRLRRGYGGVWRHRLRRCRPHRRSVLVGRQGTAQVHAGGPARTRPQ